MSKNQLLNIERKAAVLKHYGKGKLACVRCGFDDMRALSIDHVAGDGAIHRRLLKVNTIYYWLIKNKFPDGFQTLCMNCQWIKRYSNGELHYNLRTSKFLSKRIREWVSRQNTTFNYEYMRMGLSLSVEEAKPLRSHICKLKKEGLVKSVGWGLFKSSVKPISVFLPRKQKGEIKCVNPVKTVKGAKWIG